jgi:hypothetical protein
VDGFDLRAGVACAARNHAPFEQLCRYALRPTVGQDRLQAMPEGTTAPTRQEDTMMTRETITLRQMTIRYSASATERGEPVLLSRNVLRASDVALALVTLLQPEVSEVFVIVC